MSLLDHLNQDCFCISLDREVPGTAFDAELGRRCLSALVCERCRSLFAAPPAFEQPSVLRRNRAE